jgi:hypothetical protein
MLPAMLHSFIHSFMEIELQSNNKIKDIEKVGKQLKDI